MTSMTRRLIGRGGRTGVPAMEPVILLLLLLGLCAGVNGLSAADSTDMAAPASHADPASRSGQAPPAQINIDIRPGLCPNHIRLESALTIPIAVLGTVDFEVFEIDPTTVRISRDGVEGQVEPVGWAYADVGTPLIGGLCACHKRRGDGLDDLEFSFWIGDIIDILEFDGHAGETIPIRLSGVLETGEAFEGADCAHVISGFLSGGESGDEIGLLGSAEDEPGQNGFKFGYFTTVTDRITVMIYDIDGRKVAKIHDMDMPPGIYNAIWDGTDSDSLRVVSGTYFARVSNSFASDTRKIHLP